MQHSKSINMNATRSSRRASRTTCLATLVPCLLLGIALNTAEAQESADPILVCSQLTDPTARLACFDQEAKRRRAVAHQVSGTAVAPSAPSENTAANTTPVRPAAPSHPAANIPVPDDTVGLDGKQLRVKRREEGIQAPVTPPIVAKLSQLTPRSDHQYFFELDNGQVWESTDAAQTLYLAPHEAVSIRPGVLGAFFLKTQEGNSIRVHRLR